MKTKIFAKKIILTAMIFLSLAACGKKGDLVYEGERKQPKFDNVRDE